MIGNRRSPSGGFLFPPYVLQVEARSPCQSHGSAMTSAPAHTPESPVVAGIEPALSGYRRDRASAVRLTFA